MSVWTILSCIFLSFLANAELDTEYRYKITEIQDLKQEYFSTSHEEKIEFQKSQFDTRGIFLKKLSDLEKAFLIDNKDHNREIKKKIDLLTRNFKANRRLKRKTFKAKIQKQYKLFTDKIAQIKREMRKKLQSRDLDYIAFEK